jgi:hypothetical protein
MLYVDADNVRDKSALFRTIKDPVGAAWEVKGNDLGSRRWFIDSVCRTCDDRYYHLLPIGNKMHEERGTQTEKPPHDWNMMVQYQGNGMKNEIMAPGGVESPPPDSWISGARTFFKATLRQLMPIVSYSRFCSDCRGCHFSFRCL